MNGSELNTRLLKINFCTIRTDFLFLFYLIFIVLMLYLSEIQFVIRYKKSHKLAAFLLARKERLELPTPSFGD